jgi:putative mRNA 3-end processing factor
MFHFDRGLKLTSIDLAIDFRRRQPRGFISHAHTDHMAAHELAYCTPATAAMYQLRHGAARRTVEMPFGSPLDWEGTRLTTLPAGHVFGSAMLLVEQAEQTLLYTGDFKLGVSATAERAELPHADILVMECTFGNPWYRFPPREQVVGRLLELVHEALAHGATPVIHAYVLGKAQEVTKLLTDAGLPVYQHPLVYQVSRVYEACGCSLGDYDVYPEYPAAGRAVVAPPRNQKCAKLWLPRHTVSIAVTGWAVDANARYRLCVDHALPLSDHADYDELLAAVEQVDPKTVYCTHGPESFVDVLRAAGHNAHALARSAAGQR